THQSSRDRQHLLLATRERPAGLPAALREPREGLEEALQIASDPRRVTPLVGAKTQALGDGEVGEHAPILDDVGDTSFRDGFGGGPGNLPAGDAHAALARLVVDE